MSQPLKAAAQGMRELIAFRIGDQEFCIDVMSVREIRGWTPATAIPYAPPYVLGVINLRGVVLPIMDLSARLGMRPSEPSVRHVIIVTQVRRHTVGLLVEAVSDILTINEEIIQPTPEISSELQKQFARGILSIDRRMICMIELETLFPDVESQAA
ncbi:chemotaxis protein CheW [Rhizobium sp. HT1-10]|uniref:chemotaxis protein CheW n=1 Tax=Rhizobium sp. HT1-10 TaxID=3111638 RepID=UPI003C1935A5